MAAAGVIADLARASRRFTGKICGEFADPRDIAQPHAAGRPAVRQCGGGSAGRCIIKGQTYNTDTATLIARAEGAYLTNSNFTRPGEHAEVKVYQTRGGAFFLHTFSQTPRKDRNGNEQIVEENLLEPMTREEVEQWVESAGYLDYQIELLSPTIGEPPEATGEAVPAASLYIRVPTSLKVRIEEAAEANKLSVNAWAMRCMESCVARNKPKGE